VTAMLSFLVVHNAHCSHLLQFVDGRCCQFCHLLQFIDDTVDIFVTHCSLYYTLFSHLAVYRHCCHFILFISVHTTRSVWRTPWRAGGGLCPSSAWCRG